MGVRTAQVGSRALSVLHCVAKRGDWHRTLDRPADGIFHATDFRLRYELRGVGVKAESLGDGRYALAVGERRVVIHTGSGTFAGREIVWELGRDEDSVYLDGICHRDNRQGFNFNKPLGIRLAVGIELLHIKEPIAERMPELTAQPEPTLKARWQFTADQTLAVSTSSSK